MVTSQQNMSPKVGIKWELIRINSQLNRNFIRPANRTSKVSSKVTRIVSFLRDPRLTFGATFGGPPKPRSDLPESASQTAQNRAFERPDPGIHENPQKLLRRGFRVGTRGRAQNRPESVTQIPEKVDFRLQTAKKPLFTSETPKTGFCVFPLPSAARNDRKSPLFGPNRRKGHFSPGDAKNRFSVDQNPVLSAQNHVFTLVLRR